MLTSLGIKACMSLSQLERSIKMETLQELSQAYLEHLRKKGKTERTLYTYGKGTPEIVVA
jgi:hypothetical protein